MDRNSGRGRGKQNVRSIEKRDTAVEESDTFYVFSVNPSAYVMPINIEEKSVSMIVDSGSSCNILPEATFRKMPGLKLRSCNSRVYAYASRCPLEVMGSCEVRMSVQGGGEVDAAQLLVVKGDHAVLLGRKTAEELGMLRVGLAVDVYFTGGLTKDKLREIYPQAFTGLGKLKNYQLKLNIDDSVTPVAQQIRRIPFSRREKVVKKMKELENLDVIEKVNGPTQWVNPLVTVEKPNGDVRVCLGMQEANKAIIRERQPIPTVEETVQEMGEMKVFTKLDLNMAFHQVELHPESRDITTFAAPNGLYRYKRLVFGLNMASEKFNHATRQVVQDCPGAFNIHDGGVDDVQHDERVVAGLRKFAESGLTFNFEKLKFKVRKINFMGHTMSDKGLQVTENKVEAIAAAPKPKNAAEVRSFLGSALFSSKSIPDFATITQPLWVLTRDRTKWKWTKEEQRAFDEVKRRLTKAPIMAYYRLDADTRIITDASPVGLGAVLQQRHQ